MFYKNRERCREKYRQTVRKRKTKEACLVADSVAWYLSLSKVRALEKKSILQF